MSKLDPRTRRAAVDIGSRIRSARVAADISQERLAARIGMSRTNYARIEMGRTNVTLDTLLRIGRGLKLEITVTLRTAGKKQVRAGQTDV